MNETQEFQKRLSNLEERVLALEQRSQARPAPPPQPYHITKPIKSEPKQKPKPLINEKVLGKYIFGVLASILILLAAGILMVAVWDLIPNILKFIGFIGIGIGISVIGFRPKTKTAFSVSITALGMGISLLAIAAGNRIWSLYGIILTGIFVITWFLTTLKIAEKFQSDLFYLIAYIGGLIGVRVAMPLFSVHSIQNELLPGLLALSILGLGYGLNYKQKNHTIIILNFLYANVIAYLFRLEVWHARTFNEIHYNPICMAIMSILLTGLCVRESVRLWPEDKRSKNWKPYIDVLLTASCSLLFISRCFDLLCPLPHMAIAAIAILTLTGCLYIEKSLWKDMLPGILLGVCASIQNSGPMAAMLLLPLLSLDIVLTFGNNRSKRIRIAIWGVIAYTTVYAGYIPWSEYYLRNSNTLPGQWPFAIISGIIGLLTIGIIYRQTVKKLFGIYPGLESLVFILSFGIITARMIQIFTEHIENLNGLSGLTFYPITVALLYHKWKIMQTQEEFRTNLCRILWVGMTGVICFGLQISEIGASVTEVSISSMVLMAFTCSSIYAAIQSGSLLRAIASIGLANWTLLFWSGSMENGFAMRLSLLGLIIGAGFIFLGFWKERKELRLVGLITMLLYGMKLSVIDLFGHSDIFKITGGLLFGGVLLFSVSFVYNYLDKKYGKNK